MATDPEEGVQIEPNRPPEADEVGEPGELGGYRRFREFVRRYRLLNTTWLIGVFTVGATVLAAGLVMMVTPGPGWLAIFVGFAILATEFAWAQRALNHAKTAARRAKDKALDPRTRRRNQILAVILGVIVGAALTLYLIRYGFDLPWNVDHVRPRR